MPPRIDNEQRAAAYDKRIVQISALFGGIGLLVGSVLSVIALSSPKPELPMVQLLVGTLGYGAAGYWFGLAGACLFAPSDFLRGPVGTKWMKRIGTQSVASARMMCLMFLILSVPFIAVGLLMLWH